MNHNTQGVARNGNQGGSGQARPQSVPSCQGLEHPAQNASEVGAGYPYATGLVATHAAPDTRRRPVGGQASGPGLFGITGSTRHHAGSTSTTRRVLTTPAKRLVTVPVAGLALAMPKCWQPAITPAMRQAAAAADERERFAEPSLEEWERPASWGHTEAAIALD